ncbi:MAG: undecaprenyldiphospho-muramoylpentapeptide beta-N-acetylglucosaminyltransferase [Oscillospiraceae bacterium]|nr:undecaprenyldiphospho-muramoylpentapeptide beta-N-acetylglucosaminyltransferase [Oscillospiraceae bacterium]
MKKNNGQKEARKKSIILTGGGSAGHVMPNLILLPALFADGWDVHYIGSRDGIEATLARRDGVTYHAVATGKLRRYFDVKNIVDPFRVLAGICQSLFLVAKIRPRVIFSKGGFVAVPVVLGGRLMGAPVVIHESDLTQGLANRICAPFASRICMSFEKTMGALSGGARKRALYTGAPVRPELCDGDEAEGLRLCGFDGEKPVLLVIGGSQGSESLNRIVRSALPELLETWQVAHICGRGGADDGYRDKKGYAQFEFAGPELAHLYRISRAAVSRAGSNVIFELLKLKIPSVLIPLPLTASRGDQILNAQEFERSGFCLALDEEAAKTGHNLLEALDRLEADRGRIERAMEAARSSDSAGLILEAIYSAAKKG